MGRPRAAPASARIEAAPSIAAYGHKATDAVVATFFTLAATLYWVSERDRMIELLSAFAPEPKREWARKTYLAIDRRLRSYTRLKF
jgi:predicted PurR-regulated permease PerM